MPAERERERESPVTNVASIDCLKASQTWKCLDTWLPTAALAVLGLMLLWFVLKLLAFLMVEDGVLPPKPLLPGISAAARTALLCLGCSLILKNLSNRNDPLIGPVLDASVPIP